MHSFFLQYIAYVTILILSFSFINTYSLHFSTYVV